MNSALLLIDIQNDYFPGGKMEVVGADAAAANAGRLLASFRARALPIFHVQHVSTRAGAPFFLPGTPGVEIHASVRPAGNESVLIKHFPNCFRETPLLEALRAASISRLVVAGMMTHMCVDTTVRAAADLGFTCMLAADGCATRDLAFDGVHVDAGKVQAAYLAGLSGLFATVLPTERLCEQA